MFEKLLQLAHLMGFKALTLQDFKDFTFLYFRAMLFENEEAILVHINLLALETNTADILYQQVSASRLKLIRHLPLTQMDIIGLELPIFFKHMTNIAKEMRSKLLINPEIYADVQDIIPIIAAHDPSFAAQNFMRSITNILTHISWLTGSAEGKSQQLKSLLEGVVEEIQADFDKALSNKAYSYSKIEPMIAVTFKFSMLVNCLNGNISDSCKVNFVGAFLKDETIQQWVKSKNQGQLSISALSFWRIGPRQDGEVTRNFSDLLHSV